MSFLINLYKPTSKISTILYSGVIAGILDSLVAVVVYYIYFKLNPIQVVQFIATGIYGSTAINGGAYMFFVGLFFHFLIAYVCALVFFVAYPKFSIFKKFNTTVGLIFGLLIWLFMNLIVLPNSNVPKSPFDLSLAIIGIVWHMIFVGWPIAVITKNFFEGIRQNSN